MRFNNKQIEELFVCAVKAKKEGVPLVEVFKKTAEKYGMSAGSIRNIYYANLKGKGKKGLNAKKIHFFTTQEEEDMLRNVLLARSKTKSMRAAFLQVANGDKALALRYQNKYCNMLKNQRSTVLKEILSQRKSLGECFNPYLNQKKRDEKSKLEREIQELVSIISEKCKRENDLLKQKIARYQKLSVLDAGADVAQKREIGISAFFEKSAKKSIKGKAN
jgi:hypothetical protein